MGAHYLKETLNFPIEKIESWKTGVQYQLIHGLALMLFVIIQKSFQSLQLKKAIFSIKLGIILFSGSIYLLALNHSFQSSLIPKIMGPITPLGGLFLITGWIFFILALFKADFKND